MPGKIIFAACLPLPTSVNSLYSYDERTGKKHLSKAAREYIEDVQNILAYYEKTQNKHAFDPYYILHVDHAAIDAIRKLRENKSRAKAVLAQHKWYRIDTLRVLSRDLGDLDNFAKLEQDILADWIGFNDKRIVEAYPKRIVDKHAVPHSEIVIRETEIGWGSGALLEMTKLELSLGDLYDVEYGEVDKESA